VEDQREFFVYIETDDDVQKWRVTDIGKREIFANEVKRWSVQFL
jgi:hypothetical protein